MNVKVDQIKLAMQGKLLQYYSLLDFRYKSLCVKTNQEALLPIEVTVGKIEYPLEKVAQVAIIDDEHYLVAPPEQSLILPICEAFAKILPQLSQEVIDPMDNPYSSEEARNQVKGMLKIYKDQTGEDLKLPDNIILTTPEVNDDMKDVLDNSVKSLKSQCEVLYKKELKAMKVDLAKALAKEDPEELKKGNDELDKEYEKLWNEVEKITTEEIRIIEEANQRYHQREEARLRAQHNGLSEADDKVVHSMKLGDYEE